MWEVKKYWVTNSWGSRIYHYGNEVYAANIFPHEDEEVHSAVLEMKILKLCKSPLVTQVVEVFPAIRNDDIFSKFLGMDENTENVIVMKLIKGV